MLGPDPPATTHNTRMCVQCRCTGRVAQPSLASVPYLPLASVTSQVPCRFTALPIEPPECLSPAPALGTDRPASGKVGEADREQKVSLISG